MTDMPDPAGPPPPPPPPTEPPAAPPPAAPPPAAGAPWQSAAPAQAVPGAPGYFYADLPNRIIALIIDAIILFIIQIIATGVIWAIVGSPVELNLASPTFGEVNYISLLLSALASLAISAAYYVYTWVNLRGSPGMKVLGMQVGNFPDGKTLTMDQSIRRWAVLWGPGSLLQVVQTGLGGLGSLLGLVIIIYMFYLLYTTYQSPTKQGFHDKFANTVVVKAARAT
jgi:uncharacterized RDD family membrane protein YckC